jgi:hypothetical protein
VFQSSGEFSRRCSSPPWAWNVHWHGLFLGGGVDEEGRFVHVRTVDLADMSACFRQGVIAFFLERPLLNERLAKNMVEWAHSVFSVDASVGIPWPAEQGAALREAGRVPPRPAKHSPSTRSRTLGTPGGR